MKTIAIIGSTGSIGTTSLNVIKNYSKNFKVVFLYAKENFKKLNLQSKLFKPYFISLHNKNYLDKLRPKHIVIDSIDNFLKFNKKIDYVVSAISGYSALDINFKLLKISKNLLIANKETIICGGNIFLSKARKYNCKIIPIDSEHYCINFFLNNFKLESYIKNFYLTASGGPFLKKKPNNKISIKKVLNHPNWDMGKKISVNSANLVNKVMELFEASILFNIKPDNLKIKIEKSSRIHSIISLNNGLDFYISHHTNMKIPIENSLFESCIYQNNLISLNKINFELKDVPENIFPIVKTGYKVMQLGHRAMIIFTILNDRLVEMFLKNKIQFNQIIKIIMDIFNIFEIVNYSKQDIRNFADIKKTIAFANKIKL